MYESLTSEEIYTDKTTSTKLYTNIRYFRSKGSLFFIAKVPYLTNNRYVATIAKTGHGFSTKNQWLVRVSIIIIIMKRIVSMIYIDSRNLDHPVLIVLFIVYITCRIYPWLLLSLQRVPKIHSIYLLGKWRALKLKNPHLDGIRQWSINFTFRGR